MSSRSSNIATAAIVRSWFPLALTWFFMTTEAPFSNALIARLGDPKVNLAGFGVGFSIALLIEAPIFMLLPAATSFIDSKTAFRYLTRFSACLVLFLISLHALILSPWIYPILAFDVLNLPHDVAALARTVGLVFLPIPALVGFRRLWQGILVRFGRSRDVAVGTATRLGGVLICGFSLWAFEPVRGATTGALIILVGVIVEAIAAYQFVKPLLQNLPLTTERNHLEFGENPYRRIAEFYFPLALMGWIMMIVHPSLTFFLTRAPHPLESLAVFPVLTSLALLFRGSIIAVQEVLITYFGRSQEVDAILRSFLLTLTLAILTIFALTAFSPLSDFALQVVGGLSLELSSFAITPLQIMTLLTPLTAFTVWQRAFLIHARRTRAITVGSAVELATAVIAMVLLARISGVAGAVAGATALVLGDTAACIAMYPTYLKAKKALRYESLQKKHQE